MSVVGMKINFYCESDKAVLWWEKPAEATLEWSYTIYLDEEIYCETKKTHVTIAGLKSNRDYAVKIEGGAGRFCEKLTVHTPIPRERIDVTKAPYFALGNGAALNTAVLQRAIDDCPAGGSVYFPAGIYLTGALRLHSHMELYLDEGAVLQGSAEPKDYLPKIKSRFEGTELECYQSLLNMGYLDHLAGPNCEDIVLRGKGSILGGGYALAWATLKTERARLREYLAENTELVATCENEDTIPGRVRGRLINMSNCKNIRISGLTLGEGPSWNVHMIYSQDIVTDHCFIRSKEVWNGDGWDPDSSENCTIFACTFYTGDDSIAVKSGKNPEGNVVNRPTKHIRIFDNYSAFGFGIAMGSEMSGGIEDVKIWDCDFRNCQGGVTIKGTRKRGGYVRNIEVLDCIMPRLAVCSVTYNDDGIAAPTVPVFENFVYKRVAVTGRWLHKYDGWQDCVPIELRGFDNEEHAVRNVTFRDVTMPDKKQIQMEYCREIYFDDMIENERCRYGNAKE